MQQARARSSSSEMSQWDEHNCENLIESIKIYCEHACFFPSRQ